MQILLVERTIAVLTSALLRIASTCQWRWVRFVMDISGVSIELLTAWIDEIQETVYRMRVDQHIHRVIFDIIDSNPNLKANPSHLYLWMNDNYVERMAMGVRRLRDGRKKTISLKNLLRRISGNPSIISRKYYASLVGPSVNLPPSLPKPTADQWRMHLLDGWYDKLVGVGEKAPSLHELECEIAWLDALGEPIVEYATKLIAHHDETPPTVFPTLDDIDNFLGYAESLTKKYLVLIKGVEQEFHVIFNYPWFKPLEFAWLPPGTKLP